MLSSSYFLINLDGKQDYEFIKFYFFTLLPIIIFFVFYLIQSLNFDISRLIS